MANLQKSEDQNYSPLVVEMCQLRSEIERENKCRDEWIVHSALVAAQI